MQNNKRAAFIVSEYNENVYYGGGEKVNSYIIDELINRGYSVDIFAEFVHVKESQKVNAIKRDKNFDKNFDKIMTNYDLVLSTNIEYPSEITYSHSHSFMWKKNIFVLLFQRIFSKSGRAKYEKYKIALENSKKIPKIVISSNIIK